MLILWKVSHMAGILYGALTDDGYGVGTPFKSSRIGKDIGYKAFKVLRDIERQTERTGSARPTATKQSKMP